MSKLLYIQASPRGQRSKSITVADAFVAEYAKNHPGDNVETLNVFKEAIPSFDGMAVQAKYTIMHGKEHTQDELEAWKEVEKVIVQFKAADKYVLATPMWNFSTGFAYSVRICSCLSSSLLKMRISRQPIGSKWSRNA